MSKRTGSPMVACVKHLRVETSLSERTTAEPAPTEGTSNIRPVSSKVRLLQVYTLNYKPRVDVSISLNGVNPEVRFVSPNSAICITGDELVDMSNRCDQWPTDPLFLNNTRLEPLQDGGVRIVRYEKDTPEMDFPYFIPTDSFDLSKYAVNRLKQKLGVMCTHVNRIYGSEPIINLMFTCIVSAYETEYKRLLSMRPRSCHFQELTRLVEGHNHAAQIVREFSYNSSGCVWNSYSLLDGAMAQKAYILSLFEIND